MKKLISLCVSISLLISFSAPLQAKGHSSKGKSSSRSSSSKKKSSAPKETPAPAGSCPFSQISDQTVRHMLQYPSSKYWQDGSKVNAVRNFFKNNTTYRSKCSADAKEGYWTANSHCNELMDFGVASQEEVKEFCDIKNALYFDMQQVGLWNPRKLTTYVPDKNGNWHAKGAPGGKGHSSNGTVGGKGNNPDGTSADGKDKEGPGGNGPGGNGDAKDNQTSRLLLNLTQEEFEKLCKEKAENLPKVFQEMAEKLKIAIENGEDIGPFIAQIAKDSSLDPSDTHYVPFQLIQMAFLMYAHSLKPNEAEKIMQYITNKREYIRYVTASAVAEVAESSIGANGGLVPNQAPVGHLKLNSTQRAQAVKVLRESVSTYKEDSMGKRLDILRLYRLDQRETAKVATINYDSCPTSNGATVMMTLLATTGGATVAVDAAGVGTGVATGVATGGAVASESIALPATIAFVIVGVGAYELNEASRQGYVQNFVTGLLSSIPWPGSSSKEGTSAPVQISQEQVCDGLVLSQTQSPAQEVQNDDVEKGGHRVLASAVSWSSSHAQIGTPVYTSTNQPRIDCGDAGRTDPNADWGGKQWWRDRFPDGPSGANMRTRIPDLRKEINALGGNVTKTSSAREFITQGRAFRSQLSREAQMTLRELEEVNKNVIPRSNSFYNTAARGNSDAVFVKAVKSDGKWKPSVEISTETRGARHVVGEVLSPELVTALKEALCGGLSEVSSKNLGRGKLLRFGSYDVNAQKPHMHYEEDKGTYECNNSVLFNAAWDVLVPAVCSM